MVEQIHPQPRAAGRLLKCVKAALSMLCTFESFAWFPYTTRVTQFDLVFVTLALNTEKPRTINCKIYIKSEGCSQILIVRR